MPGPTVEYLRHNATTGVPTTVAPGGLKPDLQFAIDSIVLRASKIAATVGCTDESCRTSTPSPPTSPPS